MENEQVEQKMNKNLWGRAATLGPQGPSTSSKCEASGVIGYITIKEPQQRVTMKDPKKVEAGKRLAAINHKKRKQRREKRLRMAGEPVLWNRGWLWCYSSCGSDRWPWLLHL